LKRDSVYTHKNNANIKQYKQQRLRAGLYISTNPSFPNGYLFDLQSHKSIER